MTREEWKTEAEQILSRDYGIGLIDCTSDGEPPAYWDKVSPAQFAEQVATSYELERIGGWT